MADSEIDGTAASAPSIDLDAARRRLRLIWPDGRSDVFAYVWLRHAARCPGGMPNDTANKLDLIPDDPTELAIAACEVHDDRLRLRWASDDLVSEHLLADLSAASQRALEREAGGARPHLWNAAEAARLPVFDFGRLAQADGLLAVFLALRDYGFARLSNVPVEAGQVAEVARSFGTIYESNYGHLFDVRTDSELVMGANSAGFLAPHTDENYRHAPPGISFFHCLQAAGDSGGESLLVDGFAAARRVRDANPDAFNLLSRTPVEFRRFAPPQEDMRARGRVIVTDAAGLPEGIRFTDRTIPPQDLPAEQIEAFYAALKAFWRAVNSPDLQLRYLLRPGDLHIFDNQRVLHGRTAFDPTAGPRHLQQCAVARDEFHNRLRLLAARLGHPAAEADMAAGTVA